MYKSVYQYELYALFGLILYLIILVYMAIGKLFIRCILIAGVG